jgi:hypothetical protein
VKKKRENQAQIENKGLKTVEMRRIELGLGRKTLAYQEMPQHHVTHVIIENDDGGELSLNACLNVALN